MRRRAAMLISLFVGAPAPALAVDCPARSHDGGTGSCLPLRQCAEGFQVDATGHCARSISIAPMSQSRRGHSLSALQDGRALVVGGASGEQLSAALYDPHRQQWQEIEAPGEARRNHTATRLQDGRVLIVGGGASGLTQVRYGLIFDPASGRWASTSDMSSVRAGHSATLLGDGTVMIAGGRVGLTTHATVERYDPRTNSWTQLPPLAVPRAHHSATLASDGSVLVVGGIGEDGHPIAAVERYQAAEGSWIRASDLDAPRAHHAAIATERGRVLVVGGLGRGTVHRTTAIYTPGRDAWTEGPALRDPRWDAAAVKLADGDWLLLGGGRTPAGRALPGLEAFDGRNIEHVGEMREPRVDHAAARLQDGSVLVCGGLGSGHSLQGEEALPTAELYLVGR